MNTPELLSFRKYIVGDGNSTECNILSELADFVIGVTTKTICQDGCILHGKFGFGILITSLIDHGSDGPLGYLDILSPGWSSGDVAPFYLERMGEDSSDTEVRREYMKSVIASGVDCAKYVLSSERRYKRFLKWLKREKEKRSNEN